MCSLSRAGCVSCREKFFVGFTALVGADLVQSVAHNRADFDDHVNVATVLIHDGAPVAVADQLFFDLAKIGGGEDRFLVVLECLAVLGLHHRHGEFVQPITELGLR